MTGLPPRPPYLLFGLATLLCLAQAPRLFAQTEYYRSNTIASRLERLPGPVEGETYLLRVDRSAASVVETLFHDGEEILREEATLRPGGGVEARTRYEDGSPVERIVYDSRGRQESVERFSGGRPVERVVYEYAADRLASASTYGSDGELLAVDRYRYRSNGVLREVVRTPASGAQRISDYTFGDGELIREWHGSVETGELIAYDQRGRIIARRAYTDGEVDLVIRYEYASLDPTAPVSRRVMTNVPRGEVTTATFTPEGLVSFEEVREGETVVQRRSYEYEGGRLSRRTTLGDGFEETIAYEYDDEGVRTAEVLLVDGIVQVRTEFADDGSYVEERYRDGELFLRVSYDPDGERLREEIIRDGEVLRTRVFE